jgi:hypothetical protein
MRETTSDKAKVPPPPRKIRGRLSPLPYWIQKEDYGMKLFVGSEERCCRKTV